MKLLLTSGGLKNDTIKQAFASMAGKPYGELKVAYAITASMGDAGDHTPTVDEINELQSLGWKEFDIIDFALPLDELARRLEAADVLYVGGGNVYWLAKVMGHPRVKQLVEAFLRKKVYVGASAGSMVFSKHVTSATAPLFGEEFELPITGGEVSAPFSYFDWYIKPHFKSPDFTPIRDEEWIRGIAETAGFPIYCIDDQTAVVVNGSDVDVVTEGAWLMPGVQ